MKQYIGISRDHSGSMQGLDRAAMKDYNTTIDAVKKASVDNNIDTIVNTVMCGVGYGSVEREVVNSNVNALKPLTRYRAEGQTPLFDSIGELIEMMENVPDASDPSVSFLIMAITDGYENASKKWNALTLASKMRELKATDHWTFTFRVPQGCKAQLVHLGISEHNIQEWEVTEEGMRHSTVATVSSVSSYYTSRSMGLTSTDNFYANANNITPTKAKQMLTDISQEVQIFQVIKGGEQIRTFVEKQLGHGFSLGQAFYQLSKPEKEVQSYKLIVIREKVTGRVYAGQSARDLLGLPHQGTIKLAPGDHGAWDIYIQSTSTNRLLIAGTTVLYWPNAVLQKAPRARQAAHS